MATANWRPLLVALDIDGTLVEGAVNVPRDIIDAVHRVVAADIPVVLATGRACFDTMPVFDVLELPAGPMVCSNGAVVVSYPPLQVVREITFDPTEVIEAVTRLAPEALIAVEEVAAGYRLTGPFPEGDLSGDMIVETAANLCARPVARVIVRDPSRNDHDFVALAEQLGLHGVSYAIGYSAWLDIAPLGVTKASALAEVGAELGVDASDVLAIGDGRNDIEMLRWAGRGVAMGQAVPEVQQAADFVTAPFHDGGTVAELNRWF